MTPNFAPSALFTSATATGSHRTIPFRYYNTIRNNGDAVTSFVLPKSLGVWGRVAAYEEPHMLGIGSILFLANQNSHVWGSGILDPKWGSPNVDVRKIHALRGHKTLGLLRENGLAVADVPLGDPGIFVDELFPTRLAKKYRAAIVPHHTNFHHEKWNPVREADDLVLVDMMDDTMLPLIQIEQADVVVSASLHGLIYAAALGKPYVWISGHSSDVWNFKFRDWFSMCENGQNEPLLFDLTLEQMIQRAEQRPHFISKSDLIAAFPQSLVSEQAGPAPDFSFAREVSPAQVFVPDSTSGDNSPPAYAQQVRHARRLAFSGALEPTYIAFTHLDVQFAPSRAVLLAAQRFLDEDRGAGFAWISGNQPAPAVPEFKLSSQTFIEMEMGPGTMVMRPDGYIAGDQKFAYL